MSNQKLEPGWLERDVNNAATRAKELLATPAPEARPAELALRLDAMAGVFQHWLDWQKDERDREGLTTTDHTHVISVPPQWPYRATLKTWIETLQIAARASSPDAERVMRLEGVLRPFAEYGDEIDANPFSAPYPDACPLGVPPGRPENKITIGHLRAASRALSQSAPREGA